METTAGCFCERSKWNLSEWPTSVPGFAGLGSGVADRQSTAFGVAWWLSHLTAFLFGSLTALVFAIAAVIYFIHWFPYYMVPSSGASPFAALKNESGTPRHETSFDPSVDHRLFKEGWVKVAATPLQPSELNDDEDPETLAAIADKRVRKKRSLTMSTIKASKDMVVSASKSAHSALSMTRSVSWYLLSRFKGDPAPLHADRPTVALGNRRQRKHRIAYAVLRHKTLSLYTSDKQTECSEMLVMSDFLVDHYPMVSTDLDIYLRTNPICLATKPHVEHRGVYYLYMPTASEKEDWYIMLRRAADLPSFADAGAMSAYYEDCKPVRAYVDAMRKLVDIVKPSKDNPELVATAWLNALVGRAFVGIHASPKVKDWLMEKFTRRSMNFQREYEPSLLGDIVVQDLHVGDSLPILSNPQLKDISVDGDMLIELDVEYTGGARLEIKTVATIAVDALNDVVKPLDIPLVVGVQITHFAARVLIKAKPYWESNRMWIGFCRDPDIKLKLQVEPIVSNRLVKLHLVNQVLERRMKEALEEFVVLPNMEDICFWPSGGLGGMFWDDPGDAREDQSRSSTCDTIDSAASDCNLADKRRVAAAVQRGEPVESTLTMGSVEYEKTFGSLRTRAGEAGSTEFPACHEGATGQSDVSNISCQDESPETVSSVQDPWYFEQLGGAADYMGRTARYYGIDNTARSLAQTATQYVDPYYERVSENAGYARQAIGHIAKHYAGALASYWGLKAEDKLETPSQERQQSDQGEGHGQEVESGPGQASLICEGPETAAPRTQRPLSTVFEVLGVSVSTSHPSRSSYVPRTVRRVQSDGTISSKHFEEPSIVKQHSESALKFPPNLTSSAAVHVPPIRRAVTQYIGEHPLSTSSSSALSRASPATNRRIPNKSLGRPRRYSVDARPFPNAAHDIDKRESANLKGARWKSEELTYNQQVILADAMIT
ncbi:hypothetical protein HDU85_004800 [Gaertneriomyces sp. JEL0708]|nr:hypothetical protein HDU85_004800 [Gaertneriomyces sp. JEL0708]